MFTFRYQMFLHEQENAAYNDITFEDKTFYDENVKDEVQIPIAKYDFKTGMLIAMEVAKKVPGLGFYPYPVWQGVKEGKTTTLKAHKMPNINVNDYDEIIYTPESLISTKWKFELYVEESQVVEMEQNKIEDKKPEIQYIPDSDDEMEAAKNELAELAAEEKEAADKKAAEEKEAAAKKEAEEAEKNILMQEYKVAKEALSAHLQETHKKTNIMQKELYNILYKLAPVYKPPVEGLKDLNRPMDPKTTNSAFGVMRSDAENLPELERLHTMALIDMFDDNKPINNRNIPGKMEGYYKLWALDNEPKANAFKTAAEEWNEKHQLDKATHKAKHAINAMPKVAEKTGSTDIFSTVFAMGSVKKTETQKGKTVEKRKPGSSKTAPVKRAKTGKGAKSKEDDSDDNIFLDPSDEGGEQDE